MKKEEEGERERERERYGEHAHVDTKMYMHVDAYIYKCSYMHKGKGDKRMDPKQQPQRPTLVRGLIWDDVLFWEVSLGQLDAQRPLAIKTVCPSGLRGWTQVPLAQAAWVQIPQLSYVPARKS